MVSPLSPLFAASGRQQQLNIPNVGGMMRQRKTDELGQELLQQKIDQGNQPDPEQSLASARYINSLAKKLLSVDESQWGQILGSELPQLQQLGYTPEILQGMTREQIQGVVDQTDPLMQGVQEDADKLALERDKVRQRELEREQRQSQFESKQGELKPGVQKILASAQDATIESGARARQLGFLAEDLLRAGDIGAGTESRFSEFLKERLGTQDDVTELRRRVNAIRSSEAVQNLPPGVASDKDIELALKGFPAESANKEQLVSFLRGAEKLAKFQESYNRLKSEHISEHGSTRGLLQAVRGKLSEGAASLPSQGVEQSNIMRFDAQGNQIQ